MPDARPETVTSAGTNRTWMRRRLSDSVYIWACGEKADDQDEDITLSDRLIGWFILLAFAYAILIVPARTSRSSDASTLMEDSGESDYLLPTVVGAMYLLVASTAHDLRAAFSLLVNGGFPGHRAFGAGLLLVYVIMTSAAMRVLVSTSDDSTSVVLNAVTVLFIADLDEKSLKFLVDVPQKWRLFWAVETIGISFALALLALAYIGDDSPLLLANNEALTVLPTWFFWVLSPVSVTLCAHALSATAKTACDALSEGDTSVEEPTARLILTRALVGQIASIKTAIERVRGEPWFYVALCMWFAQVGLNVYSTMNDFEFPFAFTFGQTTEQKYSDRGLDITDQRLVLLYVNAMLAIGLAIKAVGVLFPRSKQVSIVPEPDISFEGKGLDRQWGGCVGSAGACLLIGCGIGYWVVSLLYVCSCAWHASDCGWQDAPFAVAIIGYIVLPVFSICCTFTAVCDADTLGTVFGSYVRLAVDRMKDRRRVEYWILTTIIRDILVMWICYCCRLIIFMKS